MTELIENMEADEIKLIQYSPTTSSSDNDAESICRDSVSSEVYVRRPGMMKSMFRRLRVSFVQLTLFASTGTTQND